MKDLKKQLSQTKKVNYDDLKFKYKGKTAKAEFDKFDNAFTLLDKIRDGKISLTDAKRDQKMFEENLGKVKRGNPTKIKRAKKNFGQY